MVAEGGGLGPGFATWPQDSLLLLGPGARSRWTEQVGSVFWLTGVHGKFWGDVGLWGRTAGRVSLGRRPSPQPVSRGGTAPCRACGQDLRWASAGPSRSAGPSASSAAAESSAGSRVGCP